MATISKQGDNYKIAVDAGRDANGKRIRKFMTYKPTSRNARALEKELRQAADEFEAKVKDGRFLEADKITFSEFIPVWEQNWAMDHLTTSVRDGYMNALHGKIERHIGSIPLGKINAPMIDSILKEEQRNGRAIKTIKRTFTVINSVFKYAFRSGMIEENPCCRVELPSERTKRMERAERKNEIHCFNVEQARRFLTAINEPYTLTVKSQHRTAESGTAYNVGSYTREYRMPLQYRVYFTVAVYSGFRRGEMLALTWSKINFKERTITIDCAEAKTNSGLVIKSPKSEAGYRTVSLPDEVFVLLRELRKEQRQDIMKFGSAWEGSRDPESNRLFTQETGAPMDPASPRKRFYDFIRIYNDQHEDKLPEIKLHDLRHTAASLLIASGMDPVTVAHRLGHADVAVTLNTYSHMFPDKDREAADTLSRLLG